MSQRHRICVFYHNVGGRNGCTRANCAFVHSIQDRVNEVFDGTAGRLASKKVETLLRMADLYPDKAADVSRHEEEAQCILKHLSLELIRDFAFEAAREAVANAVMEFRTEVAATACVVDAIATTEDPPCPYLRFSLFGELERSCAALLNDVRERPLDGDSREGKALLTQQRAVAAFEARMLLEERDYRKQDVARETVLAFAPLRPCTFSS